MNRVMATSPLMEYFLKFSIFLMLVFTKSSDANTSKNFFDFGKVIDLIIILICLWLRAVPGHMDANDLTYVFKLLITCLQVW